MKRICRADPEANATGAAALRRLTWALPIMAPLMAVLWLACGMFARGTFSGRPFLSLALLGQVMCAAGFGIGVGIGCFAKRRVWRRWLGMGLAVVVLPIALVALGEVLPWGWATQSVATGANKEVHAAQFSWMWGTVCGALWRMRADLAVMMPAGEWASADPTDGEKRE